MKLNIKLVALLSTFVFSLLTANAQIGKLRYRAEAGMTYSKVYRFLNGDRLLGMRLSGQVVVPFEDTNFALVSGLTLTNKGEKFKKGKGKVGLMYLQIPLEASMEIGFKENKFYLATGPYAGFNLTTDAGDLKNYPAGAEKPFKSFDFGWGANAMYAYRNVYLRAGVELSLSDVMNENSSAKGFIETGKGRRNGLVYLTLGYQF